MLQFAHTHKHEHSITGTLAISQLTKSHLHQMFNMHASQLMMMIGLSVVSKHDQFVKETGRTLAKQRLQPTVTTAMEVRLGTKHFYAFTTKIKVGFKTYTVWFQVSTVAESEVVKLVDAQICDVQ